ncbi:N-acetyltransferase DgcN [Caenispirillum salinarum]|uniref:N-acetyltransferase DgcN n=1 Tax=Caenispirillum salinarum TaxID=859058 RepID=UPI00384F19B7
MQLQHPYLLFLGDAHDDLAAKTAAGVYQWRPDWCVGQLRLPGCQTTLGLPDMTLEEGRKAGARTLVVGVANRGGVISDTWQETFVNALAQGYDIAAGLHQRLSDVPAVREAAEEHGRLLADVRHPRERFGVGTGEPRSGRRLLAVGTDCSVGKMYATLAIEAEMKKRGMKVDFRATGQTGIFIAGTGVSVDAVVADFISGAVESLAPANEPDHWDIIEGQGSLFHPSFAGVSLGLLHGAQADSLVLCHEPERAHMRGLPQQPLPEIRECMELNLRCAHLTNPKAKFVGICLNTKRMDDAQADRVLKETQDRYGLPACDPVRTGVAAIVDKLG